MDISLLFSSDLKPLLEIIGYSGLFLFVFAESGLFFGFFLPGDSLLFTAGLLASGGFFYFPNVLFLVFLGAILGDAVGYYFGKKAGKHLFKKEESLIFSKKNLARSEVFYEKHGPKTIMIARFVPIVRTFAPILAGVSGMKYKKFLLFNVIGGTFWTVVVVSAGYLLGNTIPNIDKYLLPIIFIIVILSFLPILWEIYKNRTK